MAGIFILLSILLIVSIALSFRFNINYDRVKTNNNARFFELTAHSRGRAFVSFSQRNSTDSFVDTPKAWSPNSVNVDSLNGDTQYTPRPWLSEAPKKVIPSFGYENDCGIDGCVDTPQAWKK